MTPSVSQQDIARACRVSVSTVSRALKNDPVIPEATRRRVLAAAERLGYRPNPLIAALMDHVRGRRRAASGSVIAYVDLASTRTEWADYAVTRAWYHAATARAAHLGYRLERIFPVHDGLTRAGLTRQLETRGIRGVVVPVSLHTGEFALESNSLTLDLSRFSVVTLGGEYTNPALDFSANDQFVSGQVARREIARLGYRRPGLVIEPLLDSALCHRFSAGFHSDPRLPAPVPVLRAYCDEQVLLAPWVHEHRPDIVVGNLPYLLDWLHSAGLSVPDDIAFACLDIDASMPGVAGIDQHSDAVAEAAVDLLTSHLQRNESGPPALNRGVRIDGIWRDGASAPGVP